MLVFIDESGDSGLKIDNGSSRYFVVSLVVFEEEEEAINCDKRIELLKSELGFSKTTEFHFSSNSDKVKMAFIDAIMPYNFFYYSIIINKDPRKLFGDGFKNKESFYKYTCGLIFENAKDKLNNAIVIIDESGSNGFKTSLQNYLKTKINKKDCNNIIKKVKMENSKSNNLLQIADYVSGIIAKSISKKNNKINFRDKIKKREIFVQTWPR